MAERTIPILPCQSIDATLAFYEALGFAVTYRQERPNTFAAITRGGIELQFFVLKALDPSANYSTCYVLVDAVDELYEAFTAGVRAKLGRIPSRGFPRIGALRDMSYGVRQFIVVDPAGNHIRIGEPIASRAPLRADAAGRLERAYEAATVLADSKGDAPTAARVLDSALADDPDPPPSLLVRALILRGDVAFRLGGLVDARAWFDRARAIRLEPDERAAVADELRRADDLEASG